jgi:phosphopantetheine adenylyltransferase
MNLVNDVEKPGSDIEFYVHSMEKVYNQQLEKINFMKTRFINLKNLLKEEEELSQKFFKLNEMMGSILTDSFHCNSQSNYSKSEDLNNFDEGY